MGELRLFFILRSKIERNDHCCDGEESVGKSFIKSYAAVCLEGAVIVLACIIFSLFASSPPVVNPDAAAVTMVWSYIGELVFNMLVLVGAVKMSGKINIRLEVAPSMVTVFLPIKNGQKKNQRFIPLALLPYIDR